MNVGRLSSNVGRLSPNVGRLSPNVAPSGFAPAPAIAGWGAAILAVVILTILFAVYYETVGYYIQVGWNKLSWSRAQDEKIEIKIPDGPTAKLTPTDGGAGAPLATGMMASIGKMESDVAAALGEGGGKQVFNVSRNVYTFSEAEPLCRAFGAELATYDQVKDAYKSGADWCNYGWVKGQLAVYPTQKETYDKLQHGPESERMSCGLPGVNGGYFPNQDQRFGVTCFGSRPAETALDERLQQADKSDIAFDRQVNHFKSELGTIAVNPWSSKKWSA